VRRVREVRCAVTFLRVTFPSAAERAAIFGSSFGGAIATVAAAGDPRVKALACLSTFATGESWLREIRPYWRFVEFTRRLETDRDQRVVNGRSEVVDPDEIMERDPEASAYVQKLFERDRSERFRYDLVSAELLMQFNVARHAQTLRDRPTLFLHAERDTLMSPEQSRTVAEACAGRFVLLPGVTHHEVYDGGPLETVLGHLTGFYSASLG